MPDNVDGKPFIVFGRKWLQVDNPHVDWNTNTVHITKSDGSKWVIKPRNYTKPSSSISIKSISLKKTSAIVKKKKAELFAVHLHPAISTINIADGFQDLVEEFKDVFRDELPNELPPKCDLDFSINTKSDEPPPVRPVIRLSSTELKELKKQLQSLLDKGFIRPSSSPYGAPVFFVKKKNGELRMVCDYRELNKITIPDANPLPLINEALDQVSDSVIFSQIDLIGAYHQVRTQKEDCHKTAIRTRFGSFEWTVLCFGLTNAHASFTRLLSTLLQKINGDCLVLFLDDILVYSKSIEEHKQHLRKLFHILRSNRLYAKLSKCSIGVSEVEFLGHKINASGVHTQKRLVDAVIEWPIPRSIKDVQSFLGIVTESSF